MDQFVQLVKPHREGVRECLTLDHTRPDLKFDSAPRDS